MARPTKATPDVQMRLVHAVGRGASYKLACRFAGIHPDTLSEWRKRAADGDQEYAPLVGALRQAEGDALVGWLEQIEHAAQVDGDWRAAAWKLERRYPDEYGRRVLDHRFPTRSEVEEAARAAARRAGVDEDEVVKRALELAEGGAG